MSKIIDYKCLPENEAGVDASKLEELSIKYPEVHTDHIQMKNLSKLIQEEEGTSYCKLPFCSTLEGEALGGIINLGDQRTGPRGKDYAYSKIDELTDLGSIDFDSGRMNEVLKACVLLKNQGEKVMLSVSGPFTILNLLIEPRYVFKGFKKNPEHMYEVLEHIKDQIVNMVLEAKKRGVDIISYGDSVGGMNILGPDLLASITEIFTYPLLKELEEVIGDEMIIHLCPKTALALVGTEKAVFNDVDLSHISKGKLTYHEAMIGGIGSIKFIGERCVKNSAHVLENGIIRSISLI